jgi:hypothetical protein
MTSSEAKPQDDESRGGGILPAALAGIGILVVAGIFIFGGGDDDEKDKKDSAAAKRERSKDGARKDRGGVESRRADDATTPSRKTPKLNPRFAGKLPTGGMAPERAPAKEEPTSFASTAEERDYWRGRVDEAQRMVEMRQRAIDRLPRLEQSIRDGNDPENGMKEFERRKEVVEENLERDTAKLDEAKAKLESLGG